MATLLLGVTLSVLDSTMIPLALPAMVDSLGAAGAEAVWIVNGFQLAALVALLPVAHLGGRTSYRRVYLGGATLLGLASAVATLADSLAVLVAARVAQGLGAAGIMAVSVALVRLTWPPALLGRGLGLHAMVVGLASVSGPMVAAAVLSLGSWRWLFALNLPVCLLLVAIGLRALPLNTPARQVRPPTVLDVLLHASLFILLFLAADRFGASARSAVAGHEALGVGALLLAGCAAVAVAHLRRQRRQAVPLLPVDLLQIRLFRLSILASVGGFAAQTMAYVTLPFLLLGAAGTSAAQAGLLMACWPAGTIGAAWLAGRLIGRVRDAWLGATGLVVLALGLATLALWATTAPGHVGWSLALCGIGFGLFQTPNNHTLMTCAPPQRSGAASAMLGTARLVGQTVGATLVAAVFAAYGERDPAGLVLGLWLACGLAVLAAVGSVRRLGAEGA